MRTIGYALVGLVIGPLVAAGLFAAVLACAVGEAVAKLWGKLK